MIQKSFYSVKEVKNNFPNYFVGSDEGGRGSHYTCTIHNSEGVELFNGPSQSTDVSNNVQSWI